MLYITSYAVIGSRCTGTYLVNAKTKAEANKIVSKIDPDYARVRSMTKKEFERDGWHWGEMVDGVTVPKAGRAAHIESGT